MGDPVPTVSVIIPAYNHARWIEQALASVYAQTLLEWELIIIDDASSDQTWPVIQMYLQSTVESRPNKITTIQHRTNQGAPATLNEALALARGAYIAILNSDDVWHKSRLACLHQYAIQHDCGFVASGLKLWDQDSRLKNASEPDWLAWYQMLRLSWHNSNDFLQTLLRGNFLITTSNFFFQRDLYERFGGFAELRYVHDYEYVLRLYQGGAKMACLWDEALLNYRLHGDNTIRERPLAALQENMSMLLGQLPVLGQHANASRLHALRTQLGEIFKYYGEEWQTEVHLKLVAKEKELFALIDDRDRWMSERDGVIQAQQIAIEQRDDWVTQRDEWIVERDALIERLQDDIVLQQGWIQERESWLSDRDEMISKRDHWVVERDGWIAERDQAIVALNLERERLLNSRSYRIGEAILSPLRSLRDRCSTGKLRPGHA